MKNWPPRDWRAILALVFSVGGSIALTILIWALAAMLLPREGWAVASESARVSTIRWAVLVASGSVLLVLTGLGFAINHRRLSGKWGDRSIDWEGGDKMTVPADDDAGAAPRD